VEDRVMETIGGEKERMIDGRIIIENEKKGGEMRTTYKPIATVFLLCLLVSLLTTSLVKPVLAQEDYTITIGEDWNVTFTECNYHNSWFEDDPNNPEPWPDQREARSEGNIAYVSLSATPGHAGVARSRVGVDFEWNLGPYTWEEVKNWPVKVIIDFSYHIEAYWAAGNGSANAGVSILGFTEPWYDFIGHGEGQSGSRGDTVSETYTTTVEELGRRIIMQAYCQAHTDAGGTSTHHSFAEVQISSIKIEFPELPPVASFTYTPENPVVGEEITFDASSSYDPDGGTIVEYSWNFGDGNITETEDKVVPHTYTKAGEYNVTLTVKDNDGLISDPPTTKKVRVAGDTIPPITTHVFEGNDPENVKITLTATDDRSGVNQTYYSVNEGSWQEASVFLIDLSKTDTINYYSVDKEGNIEPYHEITIKTEKKPREYKENMAFRAKDDMCPLPGAKYNVGFYIEYFEITFENTEIIFVDHVKVYTEDVHETWQVQIVAFQLKRNGKIIDRKTEGLGWTEESWRNIGAVDWTGKENDYSVYAQLRSSNPFCYPLEFNHVVYLIIVTPYGIIYIDGVEYCSDKTFDVEIPVRTFIDKIQDMIKPFQSIIQDFFIKSLLDCSYITLYWLGSELNLTLISPSGDEMKPGIYPVVEYWSGYNSILYVIDSPESGVWTARIDAIEVPEAGELYTFMVYDSSKVKLEITTAEGTTSYEAGECATILAKLTEGNVSITGSSVRADVVLPNDLIDECELYDDGSHGDTLDNDGIYTNVYCLSMPGTYDFTVFGNGTTSYAFERMDFMTLSVTETEEKLDLEITAKWLCWPDNCTICYNIMNIGNGTAHACHNTALYVDGVVVAHDHVPVDLAPAESYTGCFNGYEWGYTPPSDEIRVCADNSETLDELDEDNNCLTNIWMCGDVNGDDKVTMSDVRKVFNRYLDPNYPLDLPWAADVNCDGKVTMSDVRKVFNRYLDPGYELNCCCEGVE
jgi:PKD repeat protein